MSYKQTRSLIECKINCVTTQLADMGVEDSLWIETLFDLNEIAMIKASAEFDVGDIGEYTSVLFKNGHTLLINIDYKTMKGIWKEHFNK